MPGRMSLALKGLPHSEHRASSSSYGGAPAPSLALLRFAQGRFLHLRASCRCRSPTIGRGALFLFKSPLRPGPLSRRQTVQSAA